MDINSAASNAATQQYVNQARQQGQQLQNQYNQQAAQYSGQYNQDVNTANQYGSNLSNFANNMQSGTNMYNQGLQAAQKQYGLNNVNFQQLARNLTNSQNVLANLPQAVNQMGGYSGATAGQIAQNYSNLQSNIGGAVTNANNSLQNELGYVGAAQNQANQYAQAGLTSQQTKMQGLQSAYSTAVQQMQSAGNVMSTIENLQQQQGQLTAQQVTMYENARSEWVQNQAIANQANQIAAQTSLQNQQMRNFMNSGYYQSELAKGMAYNPTTGQFMGGPTNSPTFQKIKPGTTGKPATQAQLEAAAKRIMTGSTVKGPTGIASFLNPGASNWFKQMSSPGAYNTNYNSQWNNTSLNSILGL